MEDDGNSIETVRIRILPGGRMDRVNAAKYLGRKPKTLAIWKSEGKGPPVHIAGGRCFYFKRELALFLAGGLAACP